MKFSSISTRSISISALILSFLTLISTNLYFASSDSNEISGCVNKKTGNLRIASKCNSAEKLISWNKTGPRGSQGEQGLKGETGIQGIQGVMGMPGERGPIGAQGLQGIQGLKGDAGTQGSAGSSRVGSLTYVVRLPVTFSQDPSGDITNIQLASGANCSPGVVGSRILGSALEISSSTTGFQMFTCTVSVIIP